MANTYSGNVIFVDTTAATYSGPKKICSVKYFGNTSGTASIQHGSVSGSVLWEARGTADFTEDIDIVANKGIYVAVANGAEVYIYLE